MDARIRNNLMFTLFKLGISDTFVAFVNETPVNVDKELYDIIVGKK